VELATGAVARTLPGDSEPITALAASPDCKTVFAASRSLNAKIWDIESGACARTWRPHRAPVADAAVDASGGFVATAGADRLVKVWDLQGGFCTHSFSGHEGVVLKVLFHPKQLMLFSAGDDAQVGGRGGGCRGGLAWGGEGPV
jgi:U3 small nucleolar RNA-associated protein 13